MPQRFPCHALSNPSTPGSSASASSGSRVEFLDYWRPEVDECIQEKIGRLCSLQNCPNSGVFVI